MVAVFAEQVAGGGEDLLPSVHKGSVPNERPLGEEVSYSLTFSETPGGDAIAHTRPGGNNREGFVHFSGVTSSETSAGLP